MLPNANKVIVKVIVAKRGEILLGAEIAGGASVGEMINIAGLAIETGVTASMFINVQYGSHPWLTPSPPTMPLINATLLSLIHI